MTEQSNAPIKDSTALNVSGDLPPGILKEVFDKRPKVFAYDRREALVLVFLVAMIGVFSFTLGVHLGKQVSLSTMQSGPGHSLPVETAADLIPNRQELAEQAAAVPQVMDELLNQAIHDEVARTGIRLEKAKPVDLPREVASEEKSLENKTTEGTADETTEKASAAPKALKYELIKATQRPAPEGAFTVQVGSHANLEGLSEQVESLEVAGLKPYVRKISLKNGQQRFRVYLGGYDSKLAAEDSAKSYQTKHFIESFLVVDSIE